MKYIMKYIATGVAVMAIFIVGALCGISVDRQVFRESQPQYAYKVAKHNVAAAFSLRANDPHTEEGTSYLVKCYLQILDNALQKPNGRDVEELKYIAFTMKHLAEDLQDAQDDYEEPPPEQPETQRF